MNKKLEDILNEALAPELKTQLQEAFDAKVEAIRESVTEEMNREFANRYETDKSQLVEAMEKMIMDVVRVHEVAKANEIAKLRESRQKFNADRSTSKEYVKQRISEMADNSNNIISESLAKEITKLRSEKNKAVATANKLAEDVAVTKEQLSENHKKHLAKINDFVTKQIRAELTEFEQDKKNLVETRVKLISENKQRIAEMQKKFIKEAASKVEGMIKSTLNEEMTQLHEDLERNRQNSFGRRIFEAMATEYQTSFLNEGSEARKIKKVLESKTAEFAKKDQEIDEIKQKLAESQKIIESANRKAMLAEQRAERKEIMTDLLSSLRGEKKAVMESMLETTKTEALRASFNKLLPVVLNEGKKPTSKSAPTGTKVLNENKSEFVSGNRIKPIMTEDTQENEKNDEIIAIARLAGIRK